MRLGVLFRDPSHLEKEVAAEPLCLMPCTDKLSSRNHPAERQLTGARVPKVTEQGVKKVQKAIPVGSRYRLLTSAGTLHLAVRSHPSLCSLPPLREAPLPAQLALSRKGSSLLILPPANLLHHFLTCRHPGQLTHLLFLEQS